MTEADGEKGFLSSLVDREAVGPMGEVMITGRRKQNECKKDANIELLVGMDVAPSVGMRVVTSSRARDVSKVGLPCPGTIISLIEDGRACAVKWDDGDGPYKYGVSNAMGYQLAAVSPQHEPSLPKQWGKRVMRLVFTLSESKQEKFAGLQEMLRAAGYELDYRQGRGSNALVELGTTHKHICFCVIFLTHELSKEVRSGGFVKSEVEFLQQHLTEPRIMIVSLDHGCSVAALGGLAHSLARVSFVDCSKSFVGGERLHDIAAAIRERADLQEAPMTARSKTSSSR